MGVELRRYFRITLSVTISIFAGFAVSSVFIVGVGANPLQAYASLLDGAFGNFEAVSETLVKATPLIFTGLACAVAFKSNALNIGAEGQMYMGSIATTIIALSIPVLPSFVFIPLLFVGAFASGAFWAGIPAFLKIRFGANEIITTLLMNWIPFYIIQYLVTGPYQEKDRIRPQTDFIPEAARLLPLVERYRVHIGLVIAIVACILAYYFLWKTTFGFEFRATGANPVAAESMGMNIKRRIAQAMLLSGGLAALAGFSEIAGTVLTLKLGSSNLLGYGYAGILVALATKLHPLGVTFSGFLFATLIVGSESMQRGAGVPISIVYIIEAIMVIAIVMSQFVMKRLKF